MRYVCIVIYVGKVERFCVVVHAHPLTCPLIRTQSSHLSQQPLTPALPRTSALTAPVTAFTPLTHFTPFSPFTPFPPFTPFTPFTSSPRPVRLSPRSHHPQHLSHLHRTTFVLAPLLSPVPLPVLEPRHRMLQQGLVARGRPPRVSHHRARMASPAFELNSLR